MKGKINGTELKGITLMRVVIERERDNTGTVHAHSGTPEFLIQRQFTKSEQADATAFESFADVRAPATVEMEFMSANETVVKVKLTDVSINEPELEYVTGKIVETISGMSGTLQLEVPSGGTYTRDRPLYTNSA